MIVITYGDVLVVQEQRQFLGQLECSVSFQLNRQASVSERI